MIKNILIGIALFIITSLLGWIGYNTMDVPTMKEKYDDANEQLKRHDVLLDQEMTKTAVLQAKYEELEKRLNKLEK